MKIVDVIPIMKKYCEKCGYRLYERKATDDWCDRLCEGECEMFDLVENAAEVDNSAALSKQIPMKPKEENSNPRGQFSCPVCGCGVGFRTTYNTPFGELYRDGTVKHQYCSNCGQRMDWDGIK